MPPEPRVPPVPAQAPRSGHGLSRALGRAVLALGGWKVTGVLPELPKVLIIAAPHSSAWDAVWGIAAKLAMGLRVTFMAKRELFWFPLGPLLRLFGAVPTDRSGPRGAVGGMAQRFEQAEKLWLVIAPEGTRRRVERWKTGFWHIANAAQVPVVCVYFHYPDRTVGFGPTLTMSGDLEFDMLRVREFYRPWIGKRRGTT